MRRCAIIGVPNRLFLLSLHSNMALSFIGKPISLISHSDVRYRGILAGIDPQASTIQLSNVFSMGTETRRPVEEYIPPVQEPYQYIIFRASEVKDLSVDETPIARHSVHDDPAVIGASTQGAPSAPTSQPPPSYAQQAAGPISATVATQPAPSRGQESRPRQQAQSPIHTASASLETVGRAMADLRVSNTANPNGRRQRTRRPEGSPATPGTVSVPASDFDFASMNAKFDKAAVGARVNSSTPGSDRTNPSDEEETGKDGSSSAYNPGRSFFDSLSPAPVGPQRGRGGGGGGPGRGRGRGGYGFSRREEERERNVATFGEPGGVGLMGPGAYVGGWGGYGGAYARPPPVRPLLGGLDAWMDPSVKQPDTSTRGNGVPTNGDQFVESPDQTSEEEVETESEEDQTEDEAKDEGEEKEVEYEAEDEDEEGEEEEEEDDEEDDEEPALKYERIAGSLPDLLKKDTASTMCVSKSLMALGTHAGIVHVLDLGGNRLKSYKPHMASIIDIVMDETAEYVGTASLDGQVVIHSQSESYNFDLKRPMRTIALEPGFAKKTSRAFVCGGMAGNLVLHEKGWLGHKETMLHAGEGPIWQVRWRGRLIAWANDVIQGVKIYDTVSQTRITFIDRPADSPRPDLFKCTLHWQDDSTLIIAWADYIKVARIRARPRANTSAASANLPPLLTEITVALKVDCMIAGLVPHPMVTPASSSSDGTHSTLTCFLVMAYTPPDTSFRIERAEGKAEQARKAADRPELRIVSPAGEELAADAISITNYQAWGCNDYVLAEVGNDAIIPFVPTETPQLDHLVYEMILAHFLSHDRKTLLQTVMEWPRDIYDLPAVIVAVNAELERTSPSTDSVVLMECLAELYMANRQPGKALTFFLRLRRPNVFDLIRDNNLFTDVQDQALLLVEFDHELMEKRKADKQEVGPSQAIALLVDHIHSIPVDRVVKQLSARPYFLFLYLDALNTVDPLTAAAFADILVKLYAEFATQQLIVFLRASNDYNPENAYKVCEEGNLVPQMVFLLGRMGNNKKALTLIIERLGDVKQAIDFAKEQNDDDLWEDLLKYSEARPAFIKGLLENVGAEISPVRLIRRIKNGLEIPGLKESLIKILQDFHLQISLLDGCQTILNGDSSDFARKLHKDQTSGFFFTSKSMCSICDRSLQENPQTLLLLFLCRHVVHAHCTSGAEHIPEQPDALLRGAGISERGMSAKIAFESVVRARLDQGCPVCRKRAEGSRT
ncbi:unnamed protein product [Mycena citricolor]|uniref:Vacuolar protein sorting-associated protein 41 n=1 Tax=Mycena citricolor TaxID=2018698 RepID=A0AAD2HK18_9AGAR|nr:unnamed protein product [Mycena citricolor]